MRVVHEVIGQEALSLGLVLRDSAGRLSFFSASQCDEPTAEKLSRKLREELGAYARADRPFANVRDVGVQDVLNDNSWLPVTIGDTVIRVLDRRLIGMDWLRRPAAVSPPPRRFVFCSLKGGVGRTTALAVAAADLASRGRKVLVVDLDMEAPGLGALLLDDTTTPKFGVVDALVENGLGGLDDVFLADLLGPSALADRHGSIDVIPAFGARSMQHPGDILAKIARAYADDIGADGTVKTVLDQISDLIAMAVQAKNYDAVLIDSRAGLHETTASGVLGLGAEVFLFGLDDSQTFHGYAALLSHLSRFISEDDPSPEWLGRLTMVQGKAPVDPAERARFAEKCRQLFVDSGITGRTHATVPKELPEGAISFDDLEWVDGDAVQLEDEQPFHDPLTILYDERYRLFEPLQRRDLLTETIYKTSYGSLLAYIDEALASS